MREALRLSHIKAQARLLQTMIRVPDPGHIQQRSPTMYKRILVPIDGSDTAQRGLREAIGLARDTKARLHLLHVIDAFPLMVEMSGNASFEELRRGLQHYGTDLLEKAGRQAKEQGVESESIMVDVVRQRVPATIVQEATKAGCDLIVMGTHGRRGFSHVVLGSAAEGVARESTIPVLLVRDPEPAKS
jgi:nucleotide-binding universal stress UspA family protein